MKPDKTYTQSVNPGPPTDTFDAGLAAAFGDLTPGGWSQPPLLRDDPSELSPVVQPSSSEMPRGNPERYQLLGEIARGGMGVIIKGRDPNLGRDLAFKVLKAELAGRPTAVQRFVEEAQVGGQLQHPGVVPVYDIGRFADGRPYFAMKLVKGRTLADLLAERADPSADRGRFLQIFQKVCETIAYAHSKGVIHRDLKPSNVMVGAFGEVLVMDWGLAKVLPRGGIADELKAQASGGRQPPVPTEEPTVIHTARAGSGGSDTQAGSVMGTPAFMPPEQAGGEIDKLDERADVFGLGAVLCVILTGQPPYVADTSDAVRLMAVRGDLEDAFARLDACGTDTELVDLCKRCLSPKRDSRPRHAGEVAGAITEYLAAVEQRAHDAEIERVEADARAAEAVNTRREAEAKAAAERKRRRVQAVLGSLVTLVVLVGGAAASWQWRRAERALTQVTAEKEKTADALAKVTEEQARTFAALNVMTDEGIEQLFQGQFEAGEEQKEFVRQVIALYDEATKSEQDTPEGRARRADGHYRVGRLRLRIGDSTGAVESLQAAIVLLTPLSQEHPDEPTHRFHLARCRSYLGPALSELGRLSEADAELCTAIDALQALVAADGSNLDYHLALGRAQHNHGLTLKQLGRRPDAIARARSAIHSFATLCNRAPDNREYSTTRLWAYAELSHLLLSGSSEKEQVAREAVALADPLRQRHPKDMKIQLGYFAAHHNLVNALMGAGKNREAEPEARLVRDGWRELAQRFPGVGRFRVDLAHSHANLARILLPFGRWQEASIEHTAAVAIFQPLIAEFPENRENRERCLFCLERLGEFQMLVGTVGASIEAEKHYRAALKLIDEAPAADRSTREYRWRAINCYGAIGRALAGRRELGAAVPEYRTALARLEPLMAESPNDRTLLRYRAATRFDLGLALANLAQQAESLAAFRSALADYEVLAGQDGKDINARDGMARCYHLFGSILFNQHRYTEALPEFRKEQDVRTRLAADTPDPANREALGVAIREAGSCLKFLDRHPESEKEYLAAEPIFRQLVAEFPKSAAYQRHLADCLMYLAHARQAQQRFAEAEKPAAEADRLYVELYKAGATDPGLRMVYAQNTAYLAGSLAHTGDHASARQLLGKMVAIQPNDVLTYGNAACVLGDCIRAAERDPKLSDQKRKDLINEYTDRALGYLRRMLELAPGATPSERREVEKLRSDKDLDPFRRHPEFQKILAELDKLPALAPPPREAKR